MKTRKREGKKVEESQGQKGRQKYSATASTAKWYFAGTKWLFCGFRFLGPGLDRGGWIRSAGLSGGPSYTKNLVQLGSLRLTI